MAICLTATSTVQVRNRGALAPISADQTTEVPDRVNEQLGSPEE
jgi:hypothetical protein